MSSGSDTRRQTEHLDALSFAHAVYLCDPRNYYNKYVVCFLWVIPRRLNFICRRFGTLCSIFIGR